MRIALILVALFCGMRPVAAQTDGLVMQVVAGFDGYCHSDAWCPVYVVLSNEGVDVEGELSVTWSTGSDVYSRRVLLPAHSRKAYFFYWPPSNSGTRSRLAVKLRTDRLVLASEQLVVEWLDQQDRLYGVISSSPSVLNFLSDVAPAGGEAMVAHVDLEALPADPLAWESLDVLVLNDVDTTALDDDQLSALEIWVSQGGHLVVGGGAGAARTVAGLTGSERGLLPGTIGGTHSVDDLDALGEWIGAPTVAGPYPVAEIALQDGEPLAMQGDLVLLARHTFGAGTVDLLAFDAGLNLFARWDDNGRLWERVVGSGNTGVEWLTVRNGYSARDAVNAIPGLELPSTLLILGFMLVYTLLIGPVNYLVLRKLDRRELAWLTIPVLVLGFSACAYLTGFQVRGVKAIVHRLAVVHVPEGAQVGRVSQLVGVFSPRRTNYDVQVAGTGVRQIPAGYYGDPSDQALHVFAEADGLTISDLRVDVGGIQPFIAEGYTAAPGVEANLRVVADEKGQLWLEGRVRNGEIPLKEAVLIAGNGEQRLGDLDAGRAVDVRFSLQGGTVTGSSSGGGVPMPLPPYSYNQSNMPERILGPGNYWDDRSLYRRYQFLGAIFNDDSVGSSSTGPRGIGHRASLVGWAEENVPLPIEVVDRPFSTIETALYVYGLPVAEMGARAGFTIPPELIDRHVVETVGYVDVWGEGFHMEPETEITFRFAVWQGVMVGQVDGLILEAQGSSYVTPSRAPAMSLWNWEADDWQRMDVGWGQHSIPDAGRYVSVAGEVLLRVEAGDTAAVDIERLVITIEGQR
jgi:hypothetical protein